MRSPTSPAPIVLVVGDGERVVRERAHALLSSQECAIVEAAPAGEWPFSYPPAPLPRGRVAIAAYDVHRAFETAQPPHTRLVTTQAQYVFTEWAAALDGHGSATLVATLQRTSIVQHAPEVLQQRGIFGRAVIHDVDTSPDDALTSAGHTGPERDPVATRLAGAFRRTDPAERLRECIAALDVGRTAAALVATASVCQEVNDLESAARDLDEAVALAPGWAAAHFERGKVWLRREDMEAAAGAFRAAAERLPGFGGAWGNLGATLGELNRTAEALEAFEHLLALDPASPQAHNNIGVVTRELGRLPESDAAFRRVIALEPNLAVGYYNLGHTLFLQGRYHAAASAYGQGQARDPDRNPVQAARAVHCRGTTAGRCWRTRAQCYGHS